MVIGPKGSKAAAAADALTSTYELILSSVHPAFRQHLQKVNKEFIATCAQRQQARSHRSVSSAPPAAAVAAVATPDPQVRTSTFDQPDDEHSIHESDWMSQEEGCWVGGPEVEGVEPEERSDIQ